MPLLFRKRVVLAKLESSYGVDSVPTGTNAIELKNLNFTPISAELVSRDLIRPYLGNSESLLTQTFVQLDFEVEFVGSGAVGKVPGYDALLKSCGMARSATTSAVTLARVGAVATATLAAHGYVVGDKVTISGATEPEYNGEQTITAVTTNTFSYAVTGTPATPGTGTPVATTSINYAPISQSFDSVSIYFNLDGVRHVVRGARGTFDVNVAVKQIPTFKFTMTGLYTAPTDTAGPTPDFSGFVIPQVANTQNTPGFSLYGYSAPCESVSFQVANDVQYVTRIGYENVLIVDRKPAGSVVFEAPTIATRDFFSLVASNTTGAMSLSHGSKSGFKVLFNCPKVLLGNPSYGESAGVAMLTTPFTANPVSGNDEFTLQVR